MMFGMPPQPTDAFVWVQGAGGPALVCRPLEPYARHLFTSRQWMLGAAANGKSPAAWLEVARAVDVDVGQLARIHQVHGAHGVVAQSNASERPDADIVMSNDRQIALAIQTADCVPLLIFETRSGAVAAAHAGWRGLAARVPAETVAMLTREFASRPEDLMIAAGPSIGACCYEVGEDVHERFTANGFTDAELAKCFFQEPQPTRRNPSMSGLPAGRRDGHWYFDGWTATRDALVAVGVPSERIHMAELCTASHPDVLCSYRLNGKSAGRMAAVVRSATPRPSPRSRDDRRAR
jgi:polyphenol oxidase